MKGGRGGGAGAAVRVAWLAAAVALLASCTVMRLSYNHADSLIVATLDHYLDLTPAQEQAMREQTRDLLAWHRVSELPDYVKLLEASRAKLASAVTADDVLALNQAINDRLVRLGDRAAPALATLAVTLSAEQIDRLDRKLSEDKSRVARELASNDPGQSVHRRTRRFIDRADGWLGELRPDQRRLVHDAMRLRPDAAAWIVDERSRRQADLVALLRRIDAERPEPVLAADWLRAYFARLAQPVDPQEGEHHRLLQRDRAELIARLLATASARQREAVTERMGDYASDFSVLAAEHGAN